MDVQVMDRISDTLVDALNEEVKRPEFSPVEILGGFLLAFRSLAATAPPFGQPQSFVELQDAVDVVLREILAEAKIIDVQ